MQYNIWLAIDTTNERVSMACSNVLYGCESWTPRKNEGWRLDAFEIKRLKKIPWVSWTTKKTNEWVVNKAGVNRELLNTVKARKLARKLAYYGHTMRKKRNCLEKRIMQGTIPGARRRGRPRTACMDEQNQNVDRTPRGRVNQNDRGQR